MDGGSVALAAKEWPLRMVEVGEIPLAVREVPGTDPELPPALFVHGLGGSSLNWTALGWLLADAVRPMAPDLPGFGRTPPLPGPAGIGEHAEVVLDLIDSFDRPVHLFGNSMGGAIAVLVAARRPSQVASLTLTSPALPDPRPSLTSAWFAAMATPKVGPAVLRRSARLPFEKRIQLGLAMIFGNHSALPPEVLAAYEAEVRRRDSQPWVADAVLAGARSIVRTQLTPPRWSLWADAARVRCPVLLVYGGRDRLVDARVRNRAQQAFRDARLLFLPESGHVAQIEHPDEVAAGFRQLIRSVRG
jgi:pimeloyl-ACP methyl ester carboxylesterase